jgi:hypothetical protein
MIRIIPPPAGSPRLRVHCRLEASPDHDLVDHRVRIQPRDPLGVYGGLEVAAAGSGQPVEDVLTVLGGVATMTIASEASIPFFDRPAAG